MLNYFFFPKDDILGIISINRGSYSKDEGIKLFD